MAEKKTYKVTQDRPIRAKDSNTGKTRVFSITAYANRKGGSTTRFDQKGKAIAVRPYGTIIEVHPKADAKRLAKLKIQIPKAKAPETGNKDADKVILKENLNAANIKLTEAKAALSKVDKTKKDKIADAESKVAQAQLKVDEATKALKK